MESGKLFALALLTAFLALGAQAGEPSSSTPSVFADVKCYRECDMSRYERNFIGSLEYADCNEIIESGLAQVAMIKLSQPQTALRKLREKVDALLTSCENPAVRYKAYLTSVVFEHPEYFIAETYGTYADGNALFDALAERLQKKLLAAR